MSTETINQFVERNMPLVLYVCKKDMALIMSASLNFEDVVQEGRVALVKAARQFDPQRGFAFSTYAVDLIHKAILRYRRDHQLMGPKRTGRQPETLSLDAPISDEHAASRLTAIQAEECDFSGILVEEAMSVLTDREKIVVRGLVRGEKQGEIGAQIGVSQVQVSRMLKKIRARLRDYYLGTA